MKIKANLNAVVTKNGKPVLVKKAKTKGLLIECNPDFEVTEKTDAKLTAAEKEKKEHKAKQNKN